MKEYRIYKVDASTIIKAIELYGKFKELNEDVDYSKIAKGLSISDRKARESIKAAEELDLLNISDKFVSSSRGEQKLFFRKALQDFEPFLNFVFFLVKGDSPEEAARKIKILYNIERKEQDILWVFQKWGVYVGIFRDNSFEFVDEVKQMEPSTITKLISDINNELKAQIWIEKVLGNAKKYISNEEYNTLTNSILNIHKNPRNAVNSAGVVLEDVLRKIAKDQGVDVSNKNGISQIAEELRKNKILASKHVPILKGLQVFLDRDIFEGLSAFRNMAHHGKDKKEMKKWELSEELALSYIIQVVLCIKSLYYYVKEKQLTF